MNINRRHPADVSLLCVVASFILSFRVECDSGVLRGRRALMCSIHLTNDYMENMHSAVSILCCTLNIKVN